MWLDGNPKSSSPQDFTLTLTPEATDGGIGFVIRVREGAPGDLTAQASLEGGTLSSPTVTIAQGTSETLLAFTQTASTATLTLRSPTALSGPNPSDSETGYKGLIVAVVSTPVTSMQGICDRTPEVQEALLEKIAESTDCRAVTVSQLERISGTLDLSSPSVLSNPLTGLKEQDLKDLRGLEGLNLSGNSIESLSSDAFSDLESLTELDVSGNGLEGLPAVNGLTTLTSLKAFGNALPYLPAMNGLTELTYFDVSGNELTGLPAVSALAKMTHFDVSANSLVGLPDVTGLEALTNLDASGNSLTVFPDLTGLIALSRLDLSGNGIEDLPSDAFSGLSGLEIIRLDDNELTSLPQGVFVGLEALTTVWLDGNPKSSSPQDFTLTLTPEVTDDGTGFVIRVREGAPGELSAQASLAGGRPSNATVTIAQGMSETLFTFTQTASTATLTLRSPSALPGPDPANSETGYKGLVVAVVSTPATSTLGICDRTLAVQEALLEKIVGITDCRAVTVSHLERVSGTLDLSHPSAVTTALTTLKAWDFRNLRRLEGLNLSGNSITSMSNGLFANLESLVELDVSGNGLRGLPRISGLTELISLDVSANALSRLPAVNTLTKVTFLDVSGNRLSSLPNTSTLTNLTNLDVSGNDLTVFPDLTGLTALTRLDLSGNEIGGNLPSDAFSGLSGLEIIRLDDNELTGLEEGVFVGLESLTTVWLDGNPKSSSPQDFTLTLTPEITDDETGFAIKVREGAPGDLTAQANLEGGTPTSATVTIAQGMSETLLAFTQTASTVTLTLSSPSSLPGPDLANSETGYKGLIVAVVDTPVIYFNPIDDRGICPRTPQVQNAILNALPDINRCEDVTEDDLAKITAPLIITSFPDLTELLPGDFDGLSSLQRLDLSDNQLTELPDDIFSALIALITLDLSDNQLTELQNDVFSALLALTTLDLSGNQLTELPDDIFSALLALTTLDLSDNRLTALSENALSTLVALTTLDLSDNRLTALSKDVLCALIALTTLDLSDNRLTAIPENALSTLIALTTLDLSSNQLTTLSEDVFSVLIALTTLDLSDNQLTALSEDVFSALIALKTLDLSDNQLASLSGRIFSGLLSLIILDLSDNRLTDLPEGLFSDLENLQGLNLENNLPNGAPFVLKLNAYQTDQNTFILQILQGAPADITITVTLNEGTLTYQLYVDASAADVVIAAGQMESEPIRVEPSNMQMEVNRISDLPRYDPDTGMGYKGIQIELAESRPSPTETMETVIGMVNEEMLPEIGRTIVQGAQATIVKRMDTSAQQPSVQLAGQTSLSDLTLFSARAFDGIHNQNRTLVGDTLLRDTSFFIPLSETESRTGWNSVTVWGSGDYQALSGGDTLSWDGAITSFQLGSDAWITKNVLTGLSAAWSRGVFDYDTSDDSGDYELTLWSLHPYAAWSVLPWLDLWAIGGYGSGEITIDVNGQNQSGDTSLFSGSLGLTAETVLEPDALFRGITSFKFKADSLVAVQDIEDNGDAIRSMTVEAFQHRIAIEGIHDISLPSGSFATSIEVGGRNNHGDGETGNGLELAGDIRYVVPGIGLTVTLDGRWLAFHSGDLEEWGLGGSILFSPRGSDEGLNFTLTPVWGDAESKVKSLWEEEIETDGVRSPSALSLDAELGYGIPVRRGVLTPSTSIALSNEGRRVYRLGTDFSIGEFSVNLESEHQETRLTEEKRIILQGILGF